MKKLIIILSATFLFATNINAQGAMIAEDIRTYVETKKRMKSVDRVDSRIEEGPIKRGKMTIGGQEVDDANSVVYKAFQIHPEWKDITLIADWTGSMYPYVGQVLAWQAVNADKGLLKNMVLFNDGDDNLRAGRPKTIGKTGGIYFPDPTKMDKMLKTIETAVDAGGGGDSQENDLEAVLEAQKKYNTAKEFVLIADNTPVRDMSLLSQIKQPVHVILCNSGWVYDYVKIAYETGGTITLLQDQLDFSDKSKIDPKNIMLAGTRYELK